MTDSGTVFGSVGQPPQQVRPCGRAGIPVLRESEIQERIAHLTGWQLRDSQLVKSYQFDSPAAALAFVAEIGRLAEARNHHPHVHWFKREVTLALRTHKSGGLTVRDFEFAARSDEQHQPR